MKHKGGLLERTIQIDEDDYDRIEIECYPDSRILISAEEVDEVPFDIFLLASEDIELTEDGDVEDANFGHALWLEEDVTSAVSEYRAAKTETLHLIIDNPNEDEPIAIDLMLYLLHPMKAGDEPFRDSIWVDSRDYLTFDLDVKSGDRVKVFGRVTEGNDISVHIISRLYQTDDTLHYDKAYYSEEKIEELDIDYHCTNDEKLLLVLNNEYSRRTDKCVDISIQVVGGPRDIDQWTICPFCQHKNPLGSTICENCHGKI